MLPFFLESMVGWELVLTFAFGDGCACVRVCLCEYNVDVSREGMCVGGGGVCCEHGCWCQCEMGRLAC